MKPLLVLITSFIICIIIFRLLKKRIDYRLSGRIAMAVMLLFTAIGHFVFIEGMTAMIPNFIPFKESFVLITGFLEAFFALGLLIPKYKTYSGWLIIVFLILIVPGNIKAATENVNYRTGMLDGPSLNYLWFRIPLQVFFIAWVYFFVIVERFKSRLK